MSSPIHILKHIRDPCPFLLPGISLIAPYIFTHSQFSIPVPCCVSLIIHMQKITNFLTHNSLTIASKLSSHLVHVITLIECKEWFDLELVFGTCFIPGCLRPDHMWYSSSMTSLRGHFGLSVLRENMCPLSPMCLVVTWGSCCSQMSWPLDSSLRLTIHLATPLSQPLWFDTHWRLDPRYLPALPCLE